MHQMHDRNPSQEDIALLLRVNFRVNIPKVAPIVVAAQWEGHFIAYHGVFMRGKIIGIMRVGPDGRAYLSYYAPEKWWACANVDALIRVPDKGYQGVWTPTHKLYAHPCVSP